MCKTQLKKKEEERGRVFSSVAYHSFKSTRGRKKNCKEKPKMPGDEAGDAAVATAPAPTNSLSTAGFSPAPQRKRRLRRAGDAAANVAAKKGDGGDDDVDAPASSISNAKSFLDEEDELAAAYAEAGARRRLFCVLWCSRRERKDAKGERTRGGRCVSCLSKEARQFEKKTSVFFPRSSTSTSSLLSVSPPPLTSNLPPPPRPPPPPPSATKPCRRRR